MMKKTTILLLCRQMLAICVLTAFISGGVQAQEYPIDTGEPMIFSGYEYRDYRTHVGNYLVPWFDMDHYTNFSALVKPRSGWWWNPQEGGTGINLDIQQGNIDPNGNGLVFVSYYVYDTAGNPVWYTWAGFWEPASWREWRDTGVLGYLKSNGNVQKTINGRAIGGPQRQPQYVDAGLGQAVMAFTGVDKMTLTLGGETRSFQWMEWKDDLADSSRCTPGTPENPAQCKYSVLDDPQGWHLRGSVFAVDRGGVHRGVYTEAIINRANDFANPSLIRGTKLSSAAGGSVVFDTSYWSAFAALLYDVAGEPYNQLTQGSRGLDYAQLLDVSLYDIYGNRDLSRPLTDASISATIFRDAVTGDDYMLWYEGEQGAYRSTGYRYRERADKVPVLKLVYIDKNTAIGFAWDTQACFLNMDICDPNILTDDEMAHTFVIFKRLIQFRSEEMRNVNLDYKYWKK